MSTYKDRVPADQQYQLIMECRSSGLTDYQWCKEHGIYPGTFYNWVSRLRKKASYDVPDPVFREALISPAVQEVVRLDLVPKQIAIQVVFCVDVVLGIIYRNCSFAMVIKIHLFDKNCHVLILTKKVPFFSNDTN